MTVKEIIKNVCGLLGDSQLEMAIEDDSYLNVTDYASQIKKLLICYNTVLNQLITEYLPLEYTEEVTADANGFIEYKNLAFPIISILSVCDKFNKTVDYQKFVDKIHTTSNEVIIKYNYIVKGQDLDSTFVYENSPITDRIVSFGMLSEYYLLSGMFEEAVLWQNRFSDSLKSAFATLRKSKKLKNRLWG